MRGVISIGGGVELSLSILAQNGTVIADAFSVLELSFAKWESIYNDLKIAA